jgi:acetyl-CoA acetyltransferase family protein
MTRAPYVLPKSDRPFPAGHAELYSTTLGWRMVNPRMPAQWTIALGESAEILADRYELSREQQDAFAIKSHDRAHAAWEAGFYDDHVIAMPDTELTRDEGIRPGSTMEKLAKLRPAFRKDGGTVTPGNAPGLNDGSSALVVASLAFAKAHGLSPMAKVTGYATGGVEPREIFFAPVYAVRSLLEKTGTTIKDYDLIEANEAFAVQALADGRELGWDWDRVNVNGGAVALGHPIGASGARVLTTLLYALRDRGGSTGLATLCLGGGNAVALSVELM